MEWKFQDDRPIYTQLIEQMEQALAAGEYPPGSKLPAVRELAAQAGVNPNTMQRALAELENRGLLHSQRTSGRFVTDDMEKLKGLRGGMAESITNEYYERMRALGCNAEEILRLVAEQQTKEEV